MIYADIVYSVFLVQIPRQLQTLPVKYSCLYFNEFFGEYRN